MINALKTALSGLMAQSTKANAASSNIANASSTGSRVTDDGQKQPYTPIDVALTSQGQAGGVNATIVNRDPAFIPSYEPGSPFADADGLVAAPNVSLDQELITMKQAEMAYKANAQIIKVASEMHDELINSLNKDA